MEKGCTDFIIGIGGSATNDAGIGMLQALGFQFLDKSKKLLGQGGEILEKVVSVRTQNVHKSLKNAHFIVACDVQSPFYGPNGAAAVYARQKGADDSMIGTTIKTQVALTMSRTGASRQQFSIRRQHQRGTDLLLCAQLARQTFGK